MSEATPIPVPERGGETPDRRFRRNFVLLIAHGFLGQTGMRLLQAPTFLPHFVGLLAGNSTAVGLLRAAQSFGMFLSPILSASIVERRSRVKGLGILFGGAMRVQVLLLGLIALLVPGENALAWIWLVVFILGFALGMQGVVFNFVISKTVPVDRRGVLLGLRTSAAGLLLIGVSFLGGYFVDRFGFPDGYGWTFVLCFVLTTLGLVAFGLLDEPDSTERIEGRWSFGSRVLELPALLAREPAFRRFLLARLSGTFARGALPIYILFIAAHADVSGLGGLAIFTAAFVAANSFSGLLWGVLADRIGFKGVFQGALVCWALGSGLVMIVPASTLAYACVYALVGAGLSGFMLGSQNLVLEFGGQRDRPMRIAIANTGSELAGIFGFLGAGLLADRFGASWVFGTSIAFQLLAGLLMLRVQEPRRHIPPDVEL